MRFGPDGPEAAHAYLQSPRRVDAAQQGTLKSMTWSCL